SRRTDGRKLPGPSPNGFRLFIPYFISRLDIPGNYIRNGVVVQLPVGHFDFADFQPPSINVKNLILCRQTANRESQDHKMIIGIDGSDFAKQRSFRSYDEAPSRISVPRGARFHLAARLGRDATHDYQREHQGPEPARSYVRRKNQRKNGRGGEIRTHDLLYPKQAR